MSAAMKLKIYEGSCDYWTPFYGVHRHDKTMCNHGMYRLVALCPELFYMQGGKVCHPHCVVDDFGSLVAVPA